MHMMLFHQSENHFCIFFRVQRYIFNKNSLRWHTHLHSLFTDVAGSKRDVPRFGSQSNVFLLNATLCYGYL